MPFGWPGLFLAGLILRGVAFGAVEAERQTQDYGSHVKLLAQFCEGAEQTLPRGAREGRERSDAQTHLVRDGQADSFCPDVDGEDATLHGRPSGSFFWMKSAPLAGAEYNATLDNCAT